MVFAAHASRVLAHIAFSRKTASHCSRPRLRSHTAKSMTGPRFARHIINPVWLLVYGADCQRGTTPDTAGQGFIKLGECPLTLASVYVQAGTLRATSQIVSLPKEAIINLVVDAMRPLLGAVGSLSGVGCF